MMTALAGVVGSRSSGFLLDSIVPTGQTFSTYMTTLGLVGAWSPSRKLTNTYTGNIIQLRRSSDSASLYYNAGTGEGVNIPQIITDIGSNSAFYAQLYDQSGGGRNLTQASSTGQLQAINAGAILDIGGKMCLKGTGSGSIGGQYNFAFSTTCTLIFVCEVGVAQSTTARYISCFSNSGGDNAQTGMFVTDGNITNNIQAFFGSAATNTAVGSTSGFVVVRVKRNGPNVTVRVNNSVGVTTTNNGTANFSIQQMSLLSQQGGAAYSNKKLGDVLFFNTAIPDADCVTLERNMGAWYGISVAA